MTTDTPPSPGDARAKASSCRLHLLISPEDDGSVSVVVLNLPGTGSCGDSEEEGVRNALEAATGVIEEYEASGGQIPWRDSTHDPIPPGSEARWVLRDV